MRSKVYSFMVALLMIIGVVISLPFNYSVWCDYNPILSITNAGSGEDIKIKNLCTEINKKLNNNNFFVIVKASGGVDDSEFLSYSKEDDTVNVEINMTEYREYKQQERVNILNITLNAINDSDVSQTNRVKLYNFISNQDTVVSNLVKQLSDDVTADFMGAYTWFRPIARFLSVFLGLFTLVTFSLLAITICIDLSYLTFPLLNAFLNAKGRDGRPLLVSLEADKAYKEAVSINDNRKLNIIGSYFAMKSKMIVAMSICILYLVRGQIFNLVGKFMDLFMGFVG